MNSSIYSSIGRKSNENQKQNSISIDYHSVNSSCITYKDLKSINNFCSSINNYYKLMTKNNSLALKIFHLNSIKSNIGKNKKLKHEFIKTKSCDSILPNISHTLYASPKKKHKNLKISLNNEYNDFNLYNNKNIFFTLNKSNFSTTVNSLNFKNKSKTNISNIKKTLKKEYTSNSNINIYNRNKYRNIFSLNNTSYNNSDEYIENIKRVKYKRENLIEYMNKTRKIIINKYVQNDLKKIYQLEKEKIETNLEQHDLDINLLQKLRFLFNKYISSYDIYFFNLKEEIRIGKKENAKLIENKKILNNEIFGLGHTVYRIKNKLKDYLNHKYFLLSVKNHTKKFDYFTTKDQLEFNSDLLLLDKLDQRLNDIFLSPDKDKKEKNNEKDDNIEEIRKFSESKKNIIPKIDDIDYKKRYYSQRSFKDSLRVKNIFRTPKQFMKDLDLISKGINNSLKVFNKIQLELLDDKKVLSNLNKEYFDNENLQKTFQEKQSNLILLLNSKKNYNQYLTKQKKNLLSHNKKNLTKKDYILNKIKSIINNIQIYGTEKLLQYIENSENEENQDIFQNKNNNNFIINKYNNKLYMLKIIEYTIIFLKNYHNEYKSKEKENYYEIAKNIKYLTHLKALRRARENEKIKKKMEILKIYEKNKNLLFIPHQKNYFINYNIGNKNRNNNKNNGIQKERSLFDIDFDY